jgi:hypothetical protein
MPTWLTHIIQFQYQIFVDQNENVQNKFVRYRLLGLKSVQARRNVSDLIIRLYNFQLDRSMFIDRLKNPPERLENQTLKSLTWEPLLSLGNETNDDFEKLSSMACQILVLLFEKGKYIHQPLQSFQGVFYP